MTFPAVTDISYLLYDFNLLYEFSRIIVDPKYEGYKFSRYSGYRNAKRVLPDDRLEVETLRVESPFLLTAILIAAPAAIGALWVLTQTLEKIVNFPINRDILKLQRDKLRRELQSPDADVSSAPPESETRLREQLRIREAEYYFGRVEEHLRASPIRVREIEITHVSELPAKNRTRGNKNS